MTRGGWKVELYNDHIFRELRAYAQVPDDFINTGWDLEKSLEKGGGKGGTQMARIGTSYIVKELSPSDHKTLREITGSYGQHVRNGETLLCPIYLHFCDSETGRKFFAMRNGIGPGPFEALYDLKGCNDDKTMEKGGRRVEAIHKRIWNVSMWAGTSFWTKERVRYYEGKKAARTVNISMTAEHRKLVLQCIQRDTEWLAQNGIMDYSLLVAVKAGPVGTASGGSGPSTLGQRPLVRKTDNGSEEALYVSIIDFLQKWTNGKRVARVIKCLESNKATVPPAAYAARFRKHFDDRISGQLGQETTKSFLPQTPMVAAGDTGMEGKPDDAVQSRNASRQ